MAQWRSQTAEAEGRQILTWLYEEALYLNEDGGVQIRAFPAEPEGGAHMLAARVACDKQISDRKRPILARQAVLAALREGQADASGFLAVFSRLEREFLRLRPQPFVLLTSISARDASDFPSVRLWDATITFSAGVPRRFRTSEPARSHSWYPLRFRGRTPVRVHVHAREPEDAFDLALQRLDLLRAFWNLGIHRGNWSISLGGSRRPVNQLRLGPLHTLHHPDGSSAMGSYWYEPEFEENESTSALGVDGKRKAKDEERWCRRQLALLSGRDKVEALFLRYCRALDQRNASNSLLQTWAVLEDIVGNPQNYDDLIRRASFLYTDRWYLRLQFEEIRQLRNAIVHEGLDSQRPEGLIYQLKNVVEHYLVFLLKHARHFREPGELVTFLSQPLDVSVLERRRDHVELALRILRNAN